MNIAKLKVADLKKELKTRGLSTAGNKQELIERLDSAIQASGESPFIMDGEGTAQETVGDEDDEEVDADNDDEEACSDSANTSTLEISGSTTTISSPSGMSKLDSADEKSPPKRIVLNRNTVPIVEKENFESQSNKGDASSGKDGEMKTVKLSKVVLSPEERMQLRAKKFGASGVATAQTKPKAIGFTAKKEGAPSSKIPIMAPALDVLKRRAERFGSSVSAVMEKAEIEDKKRRRQERFGVSKPESKVVVRSSTKSSVSAALPSNEKISEAASKRVRITAPSGVASAVSSIDEKKKLRAKRFQIK